jgi:hypothetical protein
VGRESAIEQWRFSPMRVFHRSSLARSSPFRQSLSRHRLVYRREASVSRSALLLNGESIALAPHRFPARASKAESVRRRRRRRRRKFLLRFGDKRKNRNPRFSNKLMSSLAFALDAKALRNRDTGWPRSSVSRRLAICGRDGVPAKQNGRSRGRPKTQR